MDHFSKRDRADLARLDVPAAHRKMADHWHSPDIEPIEKDWDNHGYYGFAPERHNADSEAAIRAAGHVW